MTPLIFWASVAGSVVVTVVMIVSAGVWLADVLDRFIFRRINC